MSGPVARSLISLVRAIFPYVVVVLERQLDCLYILQVERYDPARYARWLGLHRRVVLGGVEIASQSLLVILVLYLVKAGVHGLVAYGLWLLAGHLALVRRRSLQVSQHLQYTPRAVRVSLASLVLSGMLIGGCLVVVGYVVPFAAPVQHLLAGGITGLALAGLLSPYAVWVGGILMGPVERAIFQKYLGEAERRMRRYPGRVIGITGSYGKTSTKFVLADLLASRYRVLKTPAGVNTTMGITRVIREELRDDHDYFVVECSAYGPGEIRAVCDIVHPSLAILTAVGIQHLERFGTQERIAEAKYELLAALPPEAPAVMNADDPVCLRLAERARSEGKRVLLYGLNETEPGLAIRGVDVKTQGRGTSFRVVAGDGEAASFETRLLGRWNLSNILAGLTAAKECGVPLSAMRDAVAALSPAPRRLEVKEEGGIVKILDVANSNPRGAEMALEVLAQFTGGSRILITPGMVELGSSETEENRRFGEKAAATCDYVVLVGSDQTRPIREGLTRRGFPPDRVLVARNADEVADKLAGIVRQGDVLLYENRLPDTYLEVGP